MSKEPISRRITGYSPGIKTKSIKKTIPGNHFLNKVEEVLQSKELETNSEKRNYLNYLYGSSNCGEINIIPNDSRLSKIFTKLCALGCYKIVELILDIVDIENLKVKRESTETPLTMALKSGAKEVVNLLIERKDQIKIHHTTQGVLNIIDCPNYEYMTPLKLACQNGNFEVVKLLVRSGCDFDKKEELGDKKRVHQKLTTLTPLHFACICGNLEIAKYLIKRGADIDAKSDKVEPAILMAIRSKKHEIVELLITQNANLDNIDSKLKDEEKLWLKSLKEGMVEHEEAMQKVGDLFISLLSGSKPSSVPKGKDCKKFKPDDCCRVS